MNELDWAILIVLALSTIVGVTRGVVREILSIVGWVIGIVFAIRFSPELAAYIPLEFGACDSHDYRRGVDLRAVCVCDRPFGHDFAQDA